MLLLAAPVAEPVSVAEAKIAARVDHTEFDTLIPGLISAARQMAEQETGRRFGEQTWRFELADWPAADEPLPLYRPSALAVTYWNGSAWATLATNAYAWAPVLGGVALAPALGGSFPSLPDVAIGPRVRIDATVGADYADVAASVQTYIKAMVAFWLDNPAAAQEGKLEAAPFFSHLLDGARTYL